MRPADRGKKPSSGAAVRPARRPSSVPRPEHSVAATPQAATPQALLALYRPDIAQVLTGVHAPSYRHAQVYEHLTRRPLRPFTEATALPADSRDALAELGVSTLTLADSRTASDGATKFLLATHDGTLIESVIMRYRERITACVSSQVGCPVGCRFCATGAMGFRRDLSTAEIVDQVRTASVLAAEEGRRISNLVYMGMGEPLLNLQAVLESIRILTDPNGLGMAHRALSVSTIGIPNGILRLARAEPQVNLAVSLHAADDRTRALLVPKSFRYPLSEILEAAWSHFELTHRKLLVEYVLLGGINDSVDDARRLASLLRGHVVAVNLLAWNPVPQLGGRSGRHVAETKVPTAAPSAFQPSSPAAITAFRRVLLSARIEAVVRQSKGSGIQAACGQLAGQRQSYCAEHAPGGVGNEAGDDPQPSD
jgi:23S rRNA (adenine2503-C2)-methyltransferase